MNLFNFFKRFEAFLIYETSTVKKHLALVFLALMIPGYVKFYFIFIFVLKLISLSLSEKRLPILFSLPFYRSEIFIYTFLFGFSLVLSATALGWALFNRSNSPDILRYFIFYTFYFAAILINFIKVKGSTLFIMFFLTFDLVSSFILPDFHMFFAQYSPIYQKNQISSLIIALILLLISYLLFSFERRKDW